LSCPTRLRSSIQRPHERLADPRGLAFLAKQADLDRLETFREFSLNQLGDDGGSPLRHDEQLAGLGEGLEPAELIGSRRRVVEPERIQVGSEKDVAIAEVAENHAIACFGNESWRRLGNLRDRRSAPE
jgi:hypothetical protein